MAGTGDRHVATPLVSIGVPTWNRDRYLDQALSSLLAQDYPALEIIVSDNASTDATSAVLDKWANQDPRLVVIRQPTQVSSGDNYLAVLGAAHADYFMWAADDDLWEPSFVSALMQHFVAEPELVFAMSAFDLINYAWKRRFPLPSPAIDRGNSRFQNCLNFLASESGNLLYGIFKTHQLKQTSAGRGLDYSFVDLQTINEILTWGKAHVVPTVLYHAGITAPLRRGQGGRGGLTQFLGMRESYAEYFLQSLSLFSGSPAFSLDERAQLTRSLARQVVRLMFSHENLPTTVRDWLPTLLDSVDPLIQPDLFAQRNALVSDAQRSGHLGMFDDGWAVDWTRFDLWQSAEPAELVIEGVVPLIDGGASGCGMDVFVDAQRVVATRLNAGDFVLRIPITSTLGRHRIELRFDRAVRLPEPDGRMVSALIGQVSFQPRGLASTDPVVGTSGVWLGSGWHALEYEDGRPFHWASSRAEIMVATDDPHLTCLQLEIEVGPSAETAELELLVNGVSNGTTQLSIEGRTRVELPLTHAAHSVTTVVVEAPNARRAVPGDARLLSFRAFSIEATATPTHPVTSSEYA